MRKCAIVVQELIRRLDEGDEEEGGETRDGKIAQPCEMLTLSNNLNILLKECSLIHSPVPLLYSIVYTMMCQKAV